VAKLLVEDFVAGRSAAGAGRAVVGAYGGCGRALVLVERETLELTAQGDEGIGITTPTGWTLDLSARATEERGFRRRQ
jgi:hypothetical protein